ncbi:histidine kinase [Photobacterium aquae]|uniref:histidine kinase n=1 Tax=Photobacterium aquae TaxID=1195763 RepID=A0A0J1JPP5_9GAMM|nr:histidine kinase sensor domain-containing protein [Photobacterium aquae]KLV04202.1 histidine kinase [Photobacterium aquae]
MIIVQQLKTMFGLGNRDGLAFKLFSYFAVSLIILFALQNIAEAVLVKVLLQIPQNIQNEMRELAYQADVMVQDGDMDELADWERGQRYTLFVLGPDNQAISGRELHPHFAFKLKYTRDIDTVFDNEVNQPLIGIPLSSGYQLVIQFPHQYHPAHSFAYYAFFIKLLITILILSVFSWLLARYLQAPLATLQAASHRLAEGDFSVRVGDEVGDTASEFAQLAASFDHMAHRIDLLSAQQKRLIRDVSHELKTPLARHDLALHLLKRKLPLEQHGLVVRLENESAAMNTLVSEILEFSRLENARHDLSLVPVDVAALCSQYMITAREQALPGQSIHLHIQNDNVFALADQRLLLRSLKNLVENACKYAGEQAVVEVSVLRGGEHIELVIEDNGDGIPEHGLGTVFDPFTRLQPARDKLSGGNGLGMAIVKESMSIMKGRVEAENRKSGGLRVTLFLLAAR